MNVKKIIFFAINCVVLLLCALATLEFLLRIIFPRDMYYAYPPNTKIVKILKDETLPYLDRKIVFTTNSLGLRGQEPPLWRSEKDYVLLFVGGSTTKCALLNDGKSWPELVAQNLNVPTRKHRVLSLNSGQALHTTRNHIFLLRHLLPRVRPNCVIVLCGGNEPLLFFGKDYVSDYDKHPDVLEEIRTQTFWGLGRDSHQQLPFYQKLMVWKLMQKIKFFRKITVSFQHRGDILMIMKEKRKQATRIDDALSDPALAQGLSLNLMEYKQNILKIKELCRQHGTRLIFLTQPTLHRKDLPEKFKKLLYIDFSVRYSEDEKKLTYLSGETMADIFDRYNNILKEVCIENDIEYIDLASVINNDMENFYDDGHFNNKGAQAVGSAVADYLDKTIP
ncbi:MAG: hypothetical protein KBA46_08125 [Candidatus Omnitrophica bacterium]|nr:hypothetical protein [Candidatus Omnitrophota bacterium]